MSLVIAAAQSASAPGDVAGNATNHLRLARIAAGHGARLIIFPELSLTGYELAMAHANEVRPDSGVLDPLRELSHHAGMTIVVGAPLREGQGDWKIGALVLHPDGSVGTHTKVHVHSSEEPVFSAGLGGPILRIEDAIVAMAICRDAKQPEHAARAAARGATIYAVGAMVVEPDYVVKAEWLQRHAATYGMAVLLANYAGVSGGEASAGRSALWAECGRLAAATADSEECLLVCTKEAGEWTGAVVPA